MRSAAFLRSHGATLCICSVFGPRGVQKQTRTSGGQNNLVSSVLRSREFRSRPELQGVKTHEGTCSLVRDLFRSRPELQGVKTGVGGLVGGHGLRSEADPNFRGSKLGRKLGEGRGDVQKQTRTSGGQNRRPPNTIRGGCSEADPNFRGSKRWPRRRPP